jgi:hypothetical protein
MMRKFYIKYFANDFIKALLTFVLLTAYSLQLNATIRFVSKTGLSIPPYTSWENAADSIQKCINISVFGDTIYVANGVYEEQVVMIPGLSLIGAGSDSCYIDTRDLVTTANYTSVYVAEYGLFTGFNILVYYNSSMGYGIRNTGSGSCLITLNKITRGGIGTYVGSVPVIYKNIYDNVSQGVRLFNSNAIVRNNIINTDPNSQAIVRTGVYIEAFNSNYTPTIDSNYIIAGSGNGILKYVGARPTITNNIIRFIQYGADAIFLDYTDSVKVFNNLIFIGTGSGGINNNYTLYTKMYNNYIVGNSGAYGISAGSNDIIKNNVVTDANIGIVPYTTQNLTFQYNNAWNNNVNFSGFTPDTTNLSVDPMIVNDDSTKGKLNFHLQKYSPLVNVGDPDILDKDSTRSDIGLYGGPFGESYIYMDLPPRTPVNLTAIVDSLIKLNWNRNTEADFSYYNVYRDTVFNFTVDSTKLIASVTDTFYYHTFPSNVETLYYKLTAVDNQGNESNSSEQVYVKLVSVKNEWIPVNNYILYQNYPNPFNPSTKIGYKLKERGYVKLYVYDIKGELITVLVNAIQEAGYYEVEFSGEVGSGQSAVGKSLASGIYIYQIFVKGENNIPVFSDIKKMVYVK